MTKKTYNVGDVVLVPIDDSFFAFGRLMNDVSIAIYNLTSHTSIDVRDLVGKDVLFDAGVFDTNIVNGEWKIIGSIPFNTPDESWPTPKYIRDVVKPGHYSVYYKGEIEACSEREALELEQQLMYKPDQLVGEIKKRFEL